MAHPFMAAVVQVQPFLPAGGLAARPALPTLLTMLAKVAILSLAAAEAPRFHMAIGVAPTDPLVPAGHPFMVVVVAAAAARVVQVVPPASAARVVLPTTAQEPLVPSLEAVEAVVAVILAQAVPEPQANASSLPIKSIASSRCSLFIYGV